MPRYTYKCYSCMKTFTSDKLFKTVRDGGACPRCSTLITTVNLVGGAQPETTIESDLQAIHGWLLRMRGIDRHMETRPLVGFAFKQIRPTGSLVAKLNQLELLIIPQLALLLGGKKRNQLLAALQNPLIDCKVKGVHTNTQPLLVFRFFTGTRIGLNASCQGSPGQGMAQEIWIPDRERGTVTKEAKDHQRGKKKGATASDKRSDVVSTTCSLRNLVRCSGGAYPCTPGGQVVPIIFSMDHHQNSMIRGSNAKFWAPKVTLILLPAGSYVCDWTDHLVDWSSESTSAEVSFFEREISYDTFGGGQFLDDEFKIGVWDNPFRGTITLASNTNSSSSSSSKGRNQKSTIWDK